jgi:hypothetical protein
MNLDEETQQHLLNISKEDAEHKFGAALKSHSQSHLLNYQELLEEEATRNLYNFQYVFNI